MKDKYFTELARRLREEQIETAQSQENRLDVLLNGWSSPSGSGLPPQGWWSEDPAPARYTQHWRKNF